MCDNGKGDCSVCKCGCKPLHVIPTAGNHGFAVFVDHTGRKRSFLVKTFKDPQTRADLGFGGKEFKFELLDGSVIVSNDCYDSWMGYGLDVNCKSVEGQ